MSDKDKITDQDIEHYLQGKDELSSIYSESKGLNAPEHLELKIKHMAQDAEQQSNNKNNWFLPLSLAATIILTITITFLFENKEIEDSNLVVENRINTQQKSVSVVEKTKSPKKNTMTNTETSAQKKKEQIANKEDDFELPPHLKDMVQPTHAGSEKELPPAEILKNWTKKQWQQQIIELQKSGNTKLADKYIQQFSKYFPEQNIEPTN